MLGSLPKRISLIQAPTPLHRLHQISDDLGLDLWIKRDDLTGLALGGNKGRKLEYILPDIISSGAETVVGCGSMQSNFIRQLGAVCAMHGLQCEVAAMSLPYSASSGMPNQRGLSDKGGNVLLDELFGVTLHHIENGEWEQLYAAAEDIALKLEREGKKVYRVPVGGSSPLGGYAFFAAAEELNSQAPPFDFIITASSSGSTQAGLTYAFHRSNTKLVGMAADPEDTLIEDVLRVGSGLSDLLNVEPLGEHEFDLRLDWAGDAYGIRSQAGNNAIGYVAKREGIILDPIYTGKAFAGLIDLAKSKELQGRVLFWHTGGTPALFAT